MSTWIDHLDEPPEEDPLPEGAALLVTKGVAPPEWPAYRERLRHAVLVGLDDAAARALRLPGEDVSEAVQRVLAEAVRGARRRR